jgi:creatinine amidohydrolase
MREVRWERMLPDELEQAFAACPLLYFTYGLCEPHGPQNALGLDELKAYGLACATARVHGGIVAPPDYWHVHGYGGYAIWAQRMVGEVPRPWLTCVPPWVFFRRVCYEVRTADALGFHGAVFLTGHYGRHCQDFRTLIELLQPHVGTRLAFLLDSDVNRPGFDGDGKSTGDHGGKVETSLLWALEPDCVDLSRLPAPDAPLPQFGMGPTAHVSSRRVGERMVADVVRQLGARGRDLLAAYDRAPPRHTFRTFGDVETFWRADVQPRLREFASMQDAWDGSPPPQDDSVWHENWKVPEQGFLG